MDKIVNNKRIAKNTILLYFRTLLIMAITLYTSRVVLDVLGIRDYGIYNVVGGVVAMFSLLSGSLSHAISRFITYEIGKGNLKQLSDIFCTSVNVQIGLALLVMLLGGVIGGWFLNTHMNIPQDRMAAANWVLYCSLVMFGINLISIPYNACIIAHERMTAFAYVSILEASLKLLICYLICISVFDKLISYSLLLVFVALAIRLVYGRYCTRNFKECHYHFVHDFSLLRRMGSFAGWNFLTSACWLFNTQGVNILINTFFGVTLNAARGVATQVDSAIQQLVNNFSTSINPQITKSYASGNIKDMFVLICRGAKFSCFLLLLFAIPVLYEAEYILDLWLKDVPSHAVAFLRLSIIGSMINMLGSTGQTGCMATGNIKRYTICISGIGFLVFPMTWGAYKLGFPVETTYVIFILVYICVNIMRLHVMKGLLSFPPKMFVREVVLRIVFVILITLIPPAIVANFMEESFLRLSVTTAVSLAFTLSAIYVVGLSQNEKMAINRKVKEVYKRIKQ